MTTMSEAAPNGLHMVSQLRSLRIMTLLAQCSSVDDVPRKYEVLSRLTLPFVINPTV